MYVGVDGDLERDNRTMRAGGYLGYTHGVYWANGESRTVVAEDAHRRAGKQVARLLHTPGLQPITWRISRAPAEGCAEMPATELEEAGHLCKAQWLVQPLNHIGCHPLHLPRRKTAGSVTGTLS